MFEQNQRHPFDDTPLFRLIAASPHLHTLHLCSTSPSDVWMMHMSVLHLPSLRDLTLQSVNFNRPQKITKFFQAHPFITRLTLLDIPKSATIEYSRPYEALLPDLLYLEADAHLAPPFVKRLPDGSRRPLRTVKLAFAWSCLKSRWAVGEIGRTGDGPAVSEVKAPWCGASSAGGSLHATLSSAFPNAEIRQSQSRTREGFHRSCWPKTNPRRRLQRRQRVRFSSGSEVDVVRRS